MSCVSGNVCRSYLFESNRNALPDRLGIQKNVKHDFCFRSVRSPACVLPGRAVRDSLLDTLTTYPSDGRLKACIGRWLSVVNFLCSLLAVACSCDGVRSEEGREP